MTIQDCSASKASIAHWRTEMACSSYKQKSQHCQKEQSYRYTTQNRDRLASPQGPADTGYAGDYWQLIQHTRRTCWSTQATQEDTLHTIKNTVSSSGRATRGLQENNNQAQIHLRTSIKQQKIQTKRNHRCGKARQPSGSREAQSCQTRYSNSLQQRRSQGASHRGSHHK